VNKKTNTVIFILVATGFNIFITVASFLVLLVVYGRLVAPRLPAQTAAWGLPLIFVGAIALAFVVYRKVLKTVMRHIDVEKTFDPLFKPHRPPPRD
jgi:hypothetical protein